MKIVDQRPTLRIAALPALLMLLLGVRQHDYINVGSALVVVLLWLFVEFRTRRKLRQMIRDDNADLGRRRTD